MPPAVTPAEYACALRVYDGVVFDHPLPPAKHVFVLQAAIINQPPEAATVTRRAAIIRRDDGIALLYEFADDVRRTGLEVAVYAAVYIDEQRNLAARGIAFRDKRVGGDDDGVAGSLPGRVRDDTRRRSRVTHLVNVREVFEQAKPH
jgi:hypothetical protein